MSAADFKAIGRALDSLEAMGGNVVEVDLARAALANLAPKPRTAPGPKAYRPKPPSLTREKATLLAEQWGEAIEDPERWRQNLAAARAADMGYSGNWGALMAAWGLEPDGKTPLPQFAGGAS